MIASTQSSTTLSSADRLRLLSALLRAFRSLLVAAADELWGSNWGVCSLPVEVDVGLNDPNVQKARIGENLGLRGDSRQNGREAVGMIFKVSWWSVSSQYCFELTKARTII